MRYMIIVPSAEGADDGDVTTERMLADMQAYHEELLRAGVFIDGRDCSHRARACASSGPTATGRSPTAPSRRPRLSSPVLSRCSQDCTALSVTLCTIAGPGLRCAKWRARARAGRGMSGRMGGADPRISPRLSRRNDAPSHAEVHAPLPSSVRPAEVAPRFLLCAMPSAATSRSDLRRSRRRL